MEEQTEIKFGIPKGEIKDSYFDLILRQLYHLGLQISQPNTYSNTTVPLMISFIISHIPGKDKRIELRNNIQNEIDSQITGNESIDEKNEKIIKIYIENMGNIADYLEQFMGIEKENRIGYIGFKGELNDE